MILLTSLLHVAALGGCTSSPEPAEPPAGPPHFAEWDRLVRSVVDADSAVARTVARDLTAGEVGGSAEVGSALGFLQMAKGEELAQGLAAAAIACGACHGESGVAGPEGPSWSHRSAADVLVGQAVWNREASVREKDTDVRRAWDSGTDAESRLAAALVACQGCHAGSLPSDGIRSLCADPCGGEVSLYRGPDGAVDRLVHDGDLSDCSHVMRTWTGLDGEPVHRVSDRPMAKDDGGAFRAAVDAFMAERVRAAVVECPNDAGIR